MRNCLLIAVLSSFTLVCAGCGSDRPADLPKLEPTKVTVTQGGSPVSNATVALGPLEGKWGATGMTDAQGVAVMRTNGLYEGVAVGQYAVSINKMSNADNPLTSEQTANLSYEEASRVHAEATRDVKSVIPDHLTIVSKSPIAAEIVAGANAITIEIDDYPTGLPAVMKP